MKTTLPPSVEKYLQEEVYPDTPQRFEDYPDEDGDLPVGVTFVTCLGVAVALTLTAVIIFLVSLIW